MMHSANHKMFQIPKFQMITFCDYSTLNILAANFLDFHPSFPGLIRYHPKISDVCQKAYQVVLTLPLEFSITY